MKTGDFAPMGPGPVDPKFQVNEALFFSEKNDLSYGIKSGQIFLQFCHKVTVNAFDRERETGGQTDKQLSHR